MARPTPASGFESVAPAQLPDSHQESSYPRCQPPVQPLDWSYSMALLCLLGRPTGHPLELSGPSVLPSGCPLSILVLPMSAPWTALFVFSAPASGPPPDLPQPTLDWPELLNKKVFLTVYDLSDLCFRNVKGILQSGGSVTIRISVCFVVSCYVICACLHSWFVLFSGVCLCLAVEFVCVILLSCLRYPFCVISPPCVWTPCLLFCLV